jgi:hypothetical protein
MSSYENRLTSLMVKAQLPVGGLSACWFDLPSTIAYNVVSMAKGGLTILVGKKRGMLTI